jgi:3-phosphoshikimate 1-carboxyvinyltransferase
MNVARLYPPPSPPNATVAVPGSKSYTNRALVTAALAAGASILTSVSSSTDSEAMVKALRLLGITITEGEDPHGPTLTIEGQGGAFVPYHGEINVGAAGTTMRFLTALCAGIPGINLTLSGSDRMHARPIHELVAALRLLGAEIDYLGEDGCPPLLIRSRNHLKGGTLSINGSVSSQFISALLLCSPLNTGPLSIEVEGEQISKPYIDMTIQSAGDFGVTINNSAHKRYTVSVGQKYSPGTFRVEGDASGASYLWGIAAISGGTVTVENINPQSAQGDIHFPELLARMGCGLSSRSRSITVRGSKSLKGIDVDMSNMPDTAQTLAVVASCAHGSTVMRGLSTLRIKETDRIAAVRAELLSVGIKSECGPDYLVVHGGSPRAGRVKTYDDHRMAMSFAMLSSRVAGMEIEDPSVVNKSFPTFWETLKSCGIGVMMDPGI